MTENLFYPKALVVATDNENIQATTTDLLNMGATILGVTPQPHSVSKSNVYAAIKTNDDVKFDLIRRKLEHKYCSMC